MKFLSPLLRLALFFTCLLSLKQVHSQTINIQGDPIVWHKITLELIGPQTSEQATTNPFTDLRFDVTFSHPESGTSYVVPGFFAADGDAANSSATSGNKWHAYLRPNHPGTWNYTVSFRQGSDVATSTSPNPGTALAPYDGLNGSLEISAINPTQAPDLRSKGRLRYVDKHHLQFEGSGTYFLKFGPDSPENPLEYVDFDNTPTDGFPIDQDGLGNERPPAGFIKTWEDHEEDYSGDGQTWQNGKGTELLGAINYVASTGANSISTFLYNLYGDGRRTFPYTDTSTLTRFDTSKLDQWEIIFDHAEQKGLHLHFKLFENENGKIHDSGGNTLGPERRLYYREMIARFGHHLALNWNISEEINMGGEAVIEGSLQYFEDNDPWQSNRVFHTAPSAAAKTNRYTQYLGDSEMTGVSLQIELSATSENVFIETKEWVDKSANAGRPWVCANDEQGPGNLGIRASEDGTRIYALWGNIMAGGAGVEYYVGGRDLSMQDYRLELGAVLEDADIAINGFFYAQNIPFWNMSNDDSLIDNTTAHCLTDGTDFFVVYLEEGGTSNLDLTGISGTFDVRWFDPRNGGNLQTGSVQSISGGGNRSLGNAPSSTTSDWAILVRKAQTLPELGTTSTKWVDDEGLMIFEAENADGDPTRRWQFTATDTSPDPTMDGSLGTGYIEYTGPFNGGITKEDNQVDDINIYNFEIRKPGNYTFRWRTKQYSSVERPDAGNDSYVKFETGTPLLNDERDGNGQFAVTKFTKAFVQSQQNWSYNAAFEVQGGPARFVNNPKIFYEAGAHQIQIAGRSSGHAIDRITVYHDDVPYNQSTFENTPETTETTIIYNAVTDFTIQPAVDGRTIYNANSASDFLAIDASDEDKRGKFARAALIFNGAPGVYDVDITTITEEDGESVYRLLVNGSVVRTFQNPQVDNTGDLQPFVHRWTGIPLQPGNTIAVESATDSNGLIPEGDGFAFARGRWRQLELSSSDGVVPPTPAIEVNVGRDASYLTPISSVTLSSEVTSANPVSTYQWTQVSGPNDAVLSGETTATLNLSSLIVGAYVFRLTATDSQSNTDSDEITLYLRPDVDITGRFIEFTTPLTSGGLNGQVNWNAEAGWTVDPDSNGSTETSASGEIAVLNRPITLNEGETFSYVVDFEFTGNFTTPSNFVYAFLTGLKATSDATSLNTASDEPDANLQIFSSSAAYRLLSNFSGIPGISNLTGEPNPGDQLRIRYDITLGSSAGSTTYNVQLQNMTDDTDSGTGTVTGIMTDVFDALTGSGAYLFFQSLNFAANGSGLNGVRVNMIAYSAEIPDLSSQTVIEYTAPFADGELNGQESWNAESDWVVTNAGSGTVATTTNTNIAVLDLPIILRVGDTFSYTINFEFSGNYSSPAGFAYAFLTGLKATATPENTSNNAGTDEPDVNIQLFGGNTNYRLLNNFSVINGTSTLSNAPNEGEDLRLHYELTLGADAATTTYDVRLQNLTDGTDTGTGTVTGISANVYEALLGNGAYLFYQTINPGANSSGLTGVIVDTVSLQASPLLGFARFEIDFQLIEGELGDDDKDRLLNIFEFAFGGNPKIPGDFGIPPRIVFPTPGDPSEIEFQFRRRIDDGNGLTYNVQTTTDLNANWTPYTGPVQVYPENAEFELVTISLPTETDSLFVTIDLLRE
ncbi:MAG: DUF5060 domain-containing protein [Verrucomicrobiota bacterium]